MSTKAQPVSGMEHTIEIETAVTATTSVSSTVSPKVSMFVKKSGFVIPKNKLSGSLVPIFRGSKKPGGTDVDSEESTKQAPRKTKWGPDLTQDAFVRKGRALAYQTRLDQITQQLKSGIIEANYDQDSPVAQESPDHQNIEKSELELEKREIIGEILKLNPSFKAPTDYKPLLKEAKVPIPIKEHPGHNFIALIFGPANDTQKRLEKETGAKIRVYGTKADTKKESEITSSDSNETHGSYEELHVLVTADTYEKVDAAVSLIELLVTPLLVNTKTSTVSGDNNNNNPDTVAQNQDPPPSYTTPPVVINQGAAQPFTGPGPAPPLARFQPYPNQWVRTGQSSGFNPLPFQLTINSTPLPSPFGPRPVMSGGFGLVPTQPQRPQVSNMSYVASPRNPSLPPNFSTPPSFTSTGPNQNVRPIGSLIPRSGPPYNFPDRPLTSTGWSQPPASSPTVPQNMQPMNRPQAPLAMAPASGGQPLSFGFQTGAPNPGPRTNTTTLRPQQPSSNDFTFQTHRAQQVPRPGPQLQPPQSPSFRPAPPVMQGFPRPGPHQMGQSTMPAPQARQPVFPGHGPRPLATQGQQMGVRQFGPGSPPSPFPSRPGPYGQVGFRPQNLLGPMNQQFRGHANFSSGRPPQVYDPFSPGAAQNKVGNPQSSRKQDSDPEYDDLMASVGVK